VVFKEVQTVSVAVVCFLWFYECLGRIFAGHMFSKSSQAGAGCDYLVLADKLGDEGAGISHLWKSDVHLIA